MGHQTSQLPYIRILGTGAGTFWAKKTHSLCLWLRFPNLNTCIWMASKRNRTTGSFHTQVTTYLLTHTRKWKRKVKMYLFLYLSTRPSKHKVKLR